MSLFGCIINGELVSVRSHIHNQDEFDSIVELPITFDFAKHDYVNGQIIDREEYVNAMLKQEKLNAISQLTVTTLTGKTFDGDEKSQDRMARAINIAGITGQTSTQWKLADNSIVDVTLDELKEALSLSGNKMSKIWLGV